MKNINVKNISAVICAGALLFSSISCTDDLDINSDPLAATTIDAGLLFPTITTGVSSNRTVELNALNIQAQHWTSTGSAGVFSNPERYFISPNTTNNVWVGQFTTGLRNLQQMRALTEANNPDALNIIGQAKVFEAFLYLNLTTLFGDIPFSEAIQVDEFPNPNFDAQEDVLRGIVTRLDEGITALSTETDIVTGGDLIYGGNRQNWIRFANSLKLKTLMLIANKDAASVQSQIQAVANAPLIVENSQNAYLPYSDTGGNENPVWRTLDLFAGGNNVFWYAGSTLVDLMQDKNDPRLTTYFAPNDQGVIRGQDQGVFESDSISAVSLNIIRPDLEDRYATAAETLLFLAEARAKGYISTGSAQDYFERGIRASLDSYDGQPGEIDDADKDAYIASLPALSSFDANGALNAIYEQEYIALFSRGLEAFTHWRRTKVPEFQLPNRAALNTIIRRYQYPVSEITSNPNAPAPESLDTPMWFEN